MPNLTKILVGACVACCAALVFISLDMKMHYAKLERMNKEIDKRDSIYRERQKELLSVDD